MRKTRLLFLITHHSSLITFMVLEIHRRDVLADAAAEVGGDDVSRVDGVGFQGRPVAEGGDEAGVVGARQAQHVPPDGEALNLGDDLRERAQERDVLAPLFGGRLGLVLPDDDVRQHPSQPPSVPTPTETSAQSSSESSANFSLSSCHARRTCPSVVRMLPTARRSVKMPFSFVCEMKSSPVALTAFISRSLSASRRAARASPASPSTPGRARKQTTLSGTGASSSQSADPPTSEAKRRASRQCSRRRAARPSWPK